MGASMDYRQLAADERSEADATLLLMERLKHLSAATRWEILADKIERCQPAVPVSRK